MLGFPRFFGARLRFGKTSFIDKISVMNNILVQ